MQNLPEYLVYAPLVMVLLLELLAAGVLVAYFSFMKKFNALEGEYKKLLAEKQATENKWVEQAKTKANQVIVEAQQKAGEALGQATALSKSYGEQFGMELSKVGMEQLALFQRVLEESRKETAATLKKLAEETRSQTVGEVEALRKRLTEQAEQTRTALAGVINQAYGKAEAEITKYKEERMQFVDQHAAEILEEVSVNVLPKEMSLQQKEDLIMASLEEAKRTHVFVMDPEMQKEQHVEPTKG